MTCKRRRRRQSVLPLTVTSVLWLCLFFFAATCCYHPQIVFSTYEVELKAFEHNNFRKRSIDDVIDDDTLQRHKRKQLLEYLTQDIEENGYLHNQKGKVSSLEKIPFLNLDAVLQEISEIKTAKKQSFEGSKSFQNSILELIQEKLHNEEKKKDGEKKQRIIKIIGGWWITYHYGLARQ